jgi:hypothetical protein
MIWKNPDRPPGPMKVQPWIKSIDFMGITKARIKTRGPILTLIPSKGPGRRRSGTIRQKARWFQKVKRGRTEVFHPGLMRHRRLFFQQKLQVPHGFPHRPLSLPYFIQFEGQQVETASLGFDLENIQAKNMARQNRKRPIKAGQRSFINTRWSKL